MYNPKSLKNLKPFKKGQSGHPSGPKPKPDCLISCIKAELAKISINGKDTNEQLIAAALVSSATAGSVKAIELLMAYTISKPAQTIGLTGEGGGPVKTEITINVSSEATKKALEQIMERKE